MTIKFKNWDRKKVIEAVADQLAVNADDAGNFVTAQARRNLLKIRDPRWGLGYRASLAHKLLQYEVERKSREVIINVGVGASPKSRHHGFYIEVGSMEFPAHPFLRPAVFENGRTIVRLLEGS
jgi:hypothetical protein